MANDLLSKIKEEESNKKASFYTILGIVALFVGVVLFAVITTIIKNKRTERVMQDERLKNAKLFGVFSTPVAVSPDGFIGVTSVLKTVITHIKDIKGFQINFDGARDRKIENDTGILLFNNIISKVVPQFEYPAKEVKMRLNMKNNTLVKITLLECNSHYEGGRNSDNDTEVSDDIPEQMKNVIKEFLTMLESIEKSVKGQS